MVDPNPPEVTVSSDSSPDEMEAPLVGADSKESKTSGDSNVSPNFNPRHTVGQGLHILSNTIKLKHNTLTNQKPQGRQAKQALFFCFTRIVTISIVPHTHNIIYYLGKLLGS